MAYELRYEKFAVVGPDGHEASVVFQKAGRLASGDQPELYFFDVDLKSVVVGVSGAALDEWQRSRRYLSREEKIDVAGLRLKWQMIAGGLVNADSLYIQEPDLDVLVRALGLRV